MKLAVFISVLSLLAFGKNFSEKQLARLKAKKELTYYDLAHENPGCPENSLCSEETGKKMKKWQEFIRALKKQTLKKKSLTSRIEKFRQENGIPITFLTTKKNIIGIDPILYTSRCSHHNPEDKSKTVLKGIQFFRNDPNSESVKLDKVVVYGKEKDVVYHVPYQEVPIMMQNGSLVLNQEYEDVFYQLSIASDGDWKVKNISSKAMSKALQVLEDAECPDKAPLGSHHLKTYCKQIWDADSKKARLVKLQWSCP